MKLRYLGTGAAEGVPGMFCDCDCCKKTAKAGGRNIRTRSQSVIDDRLLIDFPADTYMHVLCYGLDLKKIRNCIITHCHRDHLYPGDFENRRKDFAHIDKEEPFTVYGTAPAGIKSAPVLKESDLGSSGRVIFREIVPFVAFNADGYTITPIKANHDKATDPVNYIISKYGSTLLYAHDTSCFLPETWDYLERNKPKFDFVSLDCTYGITDNTISHMGINNDEKTRARLIELGCADESTRFCLNHFSHNGKATYDELKPIAEKMGFIVAYDGMTAEF
jgi:phosphoribosyl 1,2-cyclic phosphate phosphodiesterase